MQLLMGWTTVYGILDLITGSARNPRPALRQDGQPVKGTFSETLAPLRTHTHTHTHTHTSSEGSWRVGRREDIVQVVLRKILFGQLCVSQMYFRILNPNWTCLDFPTTSVKMINQKPYLDCNSFIWGEGFIAVRIGNVLFLSLITCHKNDRKLRAKLHVLM